MGEFITVAKISDLESGQGKVVEINGQEIALFKVGDDFLPHRIPVFIDKVLLERVI